MRHLVLLFAVALGAPAVAHARAGGGGSFHSGSSGHSGGSYSGSSGYSEHSSYSGSSDYSHSYSGGSSYGASDLPQGWAVVILVLLIVALFVANRLQSAIDSSSEEAASSPYRVEADALEPLKARDPAFDGAAFLARTRTVFRRVQEAWSAGDMTRVCGFLSDGVYERFQLLLDLQRREGRLNKIDGLEIGAVDFAHAQPGARYDVLDVRIQASCRDRYVSVKDGSQLSEDDDSFVEVWSFVRSAGARTREGAGAVAGLCPNCGAGLDINRTAVCANCKGWVNSGEFDWVLAEITQAAVWNPPRRFDDQMDALAHDPETTTQGLEDRASMLFWRWQRCLADGAPTALEGWCSEAGLAALRESGIGRRRYEDCGVGTVDVRSAKAGDGCETVQVAVLWDGRAAGPNGGVGEPSRHRTLITLSRNAGTLAVPNAGLRSGHCAGCGGTVPAAAPACENCGRGFKDPAVDWVVTDLKTSDA